MQRAMKEKFNSFTNGQLNWTISCLTWLSLEHEIDIIKWCCDNLIKYQVTKKSPVTQDEERILADQLNIYLN